MKCLHYLECDECNALLLEEFEALEKFFSLVKAARENHMTISANAFAIKDMEKIFYMDVKLSKEDSEKIWNKIQEKI